MPDDKKKDRRQYSQLVEASSIGMVFPIAIALGYFWGLGLDKLFGTRPWCTIIFSIFGVIAGFVNLFRAALRSDGTTDESTAAGGPPADGADDRDDAR
jgi:ATP synthase protein I